MRISISSKWPEDFFTSLCDEKLFSEAKATVTIRGHYLPTKSAVTMRVLKGASFFIADEQVQSVAEHVKKVSKATGMAFVHHSKLFAAKNQVSINYDKERQAIVIART